MNKSGIHIKPSHRGRFTAKAKKAGTTVQKLASRVSHAPGLYSSATVKQATFARNAAKWHHGK